jgi:hypothetical protein
MFKFLTKRQSRGSRIPSSFKEDVQNVVMEEGLVDPMNAKMYTHDKHQIGDSVFFILSGIVSRISEKDKNIYFVKTNNDDNYELRYNGNDLMTKSEYNKFFNNPKAVRFADTEKKIIGGAKQHNINDHVFFIVPGIVSEVDIHDQTNRQICEVTITHSNALMYLYAKNLYFYGNNLMTEAEYNNKKQRIFNIVAGSRRYRHNKSRSRRHKKSTRRHRKH